jgi:hypothetical protein
MHEEVEMFRPPKYVVNCFLYSVHDDNSQLEVRRYGKCFYITMAPENFIDSPPIKQQYLDYLAAERSDITNDDNMAEDYKPEDFYTWALEPCLPLFETVAPAPKQNLKTTLHDFLHPGVFYYSLRTVDGELTPVQSDGRGAGMVAPGLQLDNSAFSSVWPSFLPTEIEICITNPEDAIFVPPNKVLVNGKAICFFKLYQPGDINIALRELDNYKRTPVRSFRLFHTSEPSKTINKKTAITRHDPGCQGFCNPAKCTRYARCSVYSTRIDEYAGPSRANCKEKARCANCYEPFPAGYDHCPAVLRRKNGKIIKPTKKELDHLRRLGNREY